MWLKMAQARLLGEPAAARMSHTGSCVPTLEKRREEAMAIGGKLLRGSCFVGALFMPDSVSFSLSITWSYVETWSSPLIKVDLWTKASNFDYRDNIENSLVLNILILEIRNIETETEFSFKVFQKLFWLAKFG